ncbi:hypothetical protein [Limosilactobacillus kribbianus]|nr:hypothetical protein [Limosilactobacillus kribbianus]
MALTKLEERLRPIFQFLIFYENALNISLSVLDQTVKCGILDG